MFETYKNRSDSHVAIHTADCRQLRKRGGTHAYSDGAYQKHANVVRATEYASQTGLPIVHSSYGGPMAAREMV